MQVEVKIWENAYNGCDWATAFSSPLWHAVTNGLGEDASFEWKGIVTPLRKIKLAKGIIQGWESTIPGVPCGPICSDVPDPSRIKGYWEEINQRTKGRFLIHLRSNSPFKNAPFRSTKTVSHTIKLNERNKSVREHHKRQIRKAEEAGITVASARRNVDLDAYWEMYEASLMRWERRPARIYTKGFFEKVYEYIVRAGAGCFFIAWHGNRPQAGALALFESRRGIYWHGVSRDNPIAGSAHLLHWRIMEELEQIALVEYDFGPSAGLEGVQRFKEGFGAQPEEQVTIVGTSRLFGSYFIRRAGRCYR